jgi:hypothetical protein
VDFPTDTLARLNDNPLYRALGIRLDDCAAGKARATLAPSANACCQRPAARTAACSSP